MNRQTGYYWVKQKPSGQFDPRGPRWQVAEYDEFSNWTLPVYEERFNDNDFTEINENRILSPDEPRLDWEIQASATGTSQQEVSVKWDDLKREFDRLEQAYKDLVNSLNNPTGI